jgi:elongation factor Tu
MTQNEDMPFLMPIEDVFTVRTGAVVITGQVQQGIARGGDSVEIGFAGKPLITAIIAGLECLSPITEAWAGDNIGALLKGENLDQIKPGMLMTAPGVLSTLD